MDLSKYPRPRNGMGIHGGANAWFPLGEGDGPAWAVAQFKEMDFTLVKLLTCGEGSALDSIKACRAAGIVTIVRCYRPQPHATTLDVDPKMKARLPALVAAGNLLFEVQNEPNVVSEWPGNVIPPDAHEIVARNFATDADYILSIGGIPLITAMSPGGEPGWDDIEFLQHMVWWLRDNWGYSKLDKCAIACHNACLNHPLDYPFDIVNQYGVALLDGEYEQHEWAGTREQVEEWRKSGMNAGQKLLDPGASNSWLKYQAVHDLVLRETGLDLPVYSTEGGEWPGELQDNRYHRISESDVTDVYMTIRRMMRAGAFPDYYMGTAFWLAGSKGWGNPIDDYEHQTWFPSNGVWIDSVAAYKAEGPFDRPPYVGGPIVPPVEPLLPPTREEIRNEGWNHPRPGGIIPYNPDHAFPKYAREHGLGAPLGDTWDWRGLRLQQYVLGIVYATIDDWANIRYIDW